MRILFLCPHSRLSGGTKVIFRLADHLAKRNHEVMVSVCKLSDNRLHWLFPSGYDFELMSTPHISKHTLPNADVMVNYGDGSTFGSLPDIPHILYLQGFGVHDFPREAINLQFPYTAVVTTSNWLKDVALQFGHEQIYVVPPAIDGYFKGYPTANQMRKPTIGCLYHENSYKNTVFFVAAMNWLYKTKKDIRALFLSSQYPTHNRIFGEIKCPYSFIVDPPQHLLPSVYSSCDVWASPSLVEGFGLYILESMACGTPVVTVPSLGLDSYLVSGKNCITVSSTDKKLMADGIYTLLTKKEKRKTIIKNGLSLASKFKWGKAVENFENVLKKVIT